MCWKKKAADTVANMSASTNTVDTAYANASASTHTATNTADMSVSTSTAALTSETNRDKDVKIHQPKALNKSGVSSPLISFLFHSAIDINNSTRTTVFNPIDNNQCALSSLPREN